MVDTSAVLERAISALKRSQRFRQVSEDVREAERLDKERQEKQKYMRGHELRHLTDDDISRILGGRRPQLVAKVVDGTVTQVKGAAPEERRPGNVHTTKSTTTAAALKKSPPPPPDEDLTSSSPITSSMSPSKSTSALQQQQKYVKYPPPKGDPPAPKSTDKKPMATGVGQLQKQVIPPKRARTPPAQAQQLKPSSTGSKNDEDSASGSAMSEISTYKSPPPAEITTDKGHSDLEEGPPTYTDFSHTLSQQQVTRSKSGSNKSSKSNSTGTPTSSSSTKKHMKEAYDEAIQNLRSKVKKEQYVPPPGEALLDKLTEYYRNPTKKATVTGGSASGTGSGKKATITDKVPTTTVGARKQDNLKKPAAAAADKKSSPPAPAKITRTRTTSVPPQDISAGANTLSASSFTVTTSAPKTKSITTTTDKMSSVRTEPELEPSFYEPSSSVTSNQQKKKSSSAEDVAEVTATYDDTFLSPTATSASASATTDNKKSSFSASAHSQHSKVSFASSSGESGQSRSQDRTLPTPSKSASSTSNVSKKSGQAGGVTSSSSKGYQHHSSSAIRSGSGTDKVLPAPPAQAPSPIKKTKKTKSTADIPRISPELGQELSSIVENLQSMISKGEGEEDADAETDVDTSGSNRAATPAPARGRPPSAKKPAMGSRARTDNAATAAAKGTKKQNSAPKIPISEGSPPVSYTADFLTDDEGAELIDQLKHIRLDSRAALERGRLEEQQQELWRRAQPKLTQLQQSNPKFPTKILAFPPGIEPNPEHLSTYLLQEIPKVAATAIAVPQVAGAAHVGAGGSKYDFYHKFLHEVIDSNERMYKATINAAKDMSKLHHEQELKLKRQQQVRVHSADTKPTTDKHQQQQQKKKTGYHHHSSKERKTAADAAAAVKENQPKTTTKTWNSKGRS